VEKVDAKLEGYLRWKINRYTSNLTSKAGSTGMLVAMHIWFIFIVICLVHFLI